MLSTALTPPEQLMLELINRARADPAAEAQRLKGTVLNGKKYNGDLNEGLDPGRISNMSRQPLAPNPLLLNSIRGQLQWLLAHYQPGANPHIGQGGSSPQDRIEAAGYNWYDWGESLAYTTGFPTVNLGAAVYQHHMFLFVDTTVAGRGHRLNMLRNGYSEVGVGVIAGPFSTGQRAWSGMDFAAGSNYAFLTGVALTDSVVHNHFYEVGEGIGGVVVTATNNATSQVYTDTTGAAGGYAIELPSGTYTVTAVGGGINRTLQVVMGNWNVKRDFELNPDTMAPTASADLSDALVGSSQPYTLAVTYADNVGIGRGSIDGSAYASDIEVTGPGGYDQRATLLDVGSSLPGTPVKGTYQITPPSGGWVEGSYVVSINANEVSDRAGNYVAASSLGDFNLAVDNTPPAAVISPTSGQTRATRINYTVTFSEPVSDFSAGDVTIGGTAAPRHVVVSGTGATYTVSVSGMTSAGSVTVALVAGVAHDAAGNPSDPSNTGRVDFVFPVDRLGVFRGGLAAGKWLLDTGGSGTVVNFDGKKGDTPVAGDFDGDGNDELGVFRNGLWYIDWNHNGILDADERVAPMRWRFGGGGDKPVVADWDGDGADDIAVYHAATGQFYRDINGNHVLDATERRSAPRFDGKTGGIPVVGNWSNNHLGDELGVYRGGEWRLDLDGNGSFLTGAANHSYIYKSGARGEAPMAGDWDGDGVTNLAVFVNGSWFLDDGDHVFNEAAVAFGKNGDKGAAGKW